MKTRDYLVLMIVSLLLAVPACWVYPDEAIAPPDFSPGTPAPVVVDTCEQYVPVDTPHFCNLYADYGPHPPSVTTIYTPFDTMVWIPGENFSDSMEAFLSNIWPQYEFHVYGAAAERASIVVIGTNDDNFFDRNLWFSNAFAGSSGYGSQAYALFLQGQATYEEFDTLSRRLQSVQWFNLRGPYTQEQITQLARNLNGKCKLGGEWADFRFAAFLPPQILIDSFHLSQWDKVLQ